MFWLVVAAIFWQWRGREIAGASCLAGATLMKVFPALLLIYFVWRRRWRFVMATVVLLLVGGFALPAVAFGVRKSWGYWRTWETVVALPALHTQRGPPQTALQRQLVDFHKVRNESLYAVLRRLTHTRRAREWAVGILMAMAAVMWAVGSRASPRDELLLLSAVLVWMVLAPPISWSHYFILLLLPLTALITVAARREDAVTRRAAWAALVVFGLASLAAVTLKGKLETYGLPCWAALGVWGALVAAAERRVQCP